MDPSIVTSSPSSSPSISNEISFFDYLSDFSLLYDGKIFHVHRPILALKSPVFRAMFLDTEAKSVEIPLQKRLDGSKINANEFHEFLKLFYFSDRALELENSNSIEESKTKINYFIDQNVRATWKTNRTIYNATIQGINSDGTFDLLYDDGDRDYRVSEKNIVQPRLSGMSISNENKISLSFAESILYFIHYFDCSNFFQPENFLISAASENSSDLIPLFWKILYYCDRYQLKQNLDRVLCYGSLYNIYSSNSKIAVKTKAEIFPQLSHSTQIRLLEAVVRHLQKTQTAGV